MSGSSIYDKARARQFPIAADLAHRSYISSPLLDTFLQDIEKHIPDIKTHISDLSEKDEWKDFIAKCTSGSSVGGTSDSNENEFRKLIQCIAGLDGLKEYFADRQEEKQDEKQEDQQCDNPRWSRVRISHQGNIPMTTWNTQAKWLKGNYGSTDRQHELKPDLMSIVVEDIEDTRPRRARPRRVQPAIPPTILPPPDNWESESMKAKAFPLLECRKPVWECLDVFWECKRNSEALKAEVYIDCALKAAEVLRYQWSRRFVYCFLHCGTKMQLLHFDRSGLMASEPIDIRTETDRFVLCLLGVFRHKPSKLGYPAGEDAPFHKHDPHDPDNKLLQVVTVGNRQLYISDQEAGPPRDHLVSRATTVFKAKLVDPKGAEKTGWDWCYKSSWIQKNRREEGEYLHHLQGLPNVVELLAYGVVKVENNKDTTLLGRQCSSGEPMDLISTYFEQERKQKTDFVMHTASRGSQPPGSQPFGLDQLHDPRRPITESQQDLDDKERREVVTAWVASSFNEAASTLDSLPAIFSIWQQAFSAIKSITEKGVLHRDVSFRNIRIDDRHQVKVCDFDMAIFAGDPSSGAQDKTGTVAFMAISSLSCQPSSHRPLYDCEAIFWLCTLDLLSRVGIGDTQGTLANIMGSGKSISSVIDAKKALVSDLGTPDDIESWDASSFSLGDPKDMLLYFCLTTLAGEFFRNGCHKNYRTAKGGFERLCFDRCIKIINDASDSAIQQATRGLQNMTLSN